MARIRTIKPSFWNDDNVVQLSRDARLLAVGLISMADDEGRFVATTQAVGGYVYPQDRISPKQIERWLSEVAAVGMIELYQVGHRTYGSFPNWRKHQKINRSTPSPLPAPPSVNGSRNQSVNDSVR